MAQIIGTSGAWQEIINLLAEIGLQVASPGEIQPHLEEQKRQLGQKMAEAQESIDRALKPLAEEIRLAKENIHKGQAPRLAELNEDIRQAELHLELFRLDKSLVGRVSSQFRIRRQEKKLAALVQARDEINGRMKRLLDDQDQFLAEKRAAIEAEAIEGYKDINTRVTTLKAVLESPALANALVELEMLEQFRRLPANAWVLNGLHLETDTAIRFEGKAFWEARIDHLVITPSGLFAIEVQQGGKQTPAGDPFEQIRRAAHLCHELLKDDFPQVTVRTVLAYRNALPEGLQNPYVKTVPLAEVTRYIDWFKDNSLNALQTKKIADFMAEFGHQA